MYVLGGNVTKIEIFPIKFSFYFRKKSLYGQVFIMAIIHVLVILFAKPKEFQMIERLINNFDKHLNAFQGQLLCSPSFLTCLVLCFLCLST